MCRIGLPLKPQTKLTAPFKDLPEAVIETFLKFDSFNFIKLSALSKAYRRQVSQAMDDLANKVENGFVTAYYETLFFKRSFTWCKPISVCGQKGLRIDRVFECEVVAPPHQTHTISFSFEFENDRNSYRAEYKFDCKPKSSRRETWVHVDRQSNEAYSQAIQPVNVGDTIQFSITLFNLNGAVKQVRWDQPQATATPNLSSLNYDRDRTKWLMFKHSSQKIYCDLNRICEIEDSATEWYDPKYYTLNPLFDLSFLQPYFRLVSLKYTGVDGSICKCHLQAVQAGEVNPVKLCDFKVRVLAASDLCNEVKRIGYLRDRERPLELRVGDNLILYISTAVA